MRSVPFFVEDGGEPYRPAVVLWVEAPSGLIVGEEMLDPGEIEGAVGRVLVSALARPLARAQPAPDAVRVGDAELAEEVRAVLGGEVPIEIAPTPEIDGGRIEPHAVERLFAAARLLHEAAPWKVATDDRPVRMDIPGLEVEGACVSIIGSLDESLGLLVFPSLEGYEAFLEAVDRAPQSPPGGRPDLGSDWLALTLERRADLTDTMRREVMSHGWPLAVVDANPVVEHFDRDGVPRPAAVRDLEIAAACATSLCAFFAQHRAAFEAEAIVPVCESYFDEDDLEVRFTIPYGAYPLFDVADGSASPFGAAARSGRAKVGCNAPCPCGSGRKYKKCHGPLDAEAAAARPRRGAVHELDELLVGELTGFAIERFDVDMRQLARVFDDPLQAAQLAAPWLVYHHEIEGTPVVDRYLAEHGKGLSREKRSWLAAQRDTWLSVWEVTEVEAGIGMTLRDLLSEETRQVHEVLGSRTLVVRDAVLARVVEYEGVSHLCGLYPRSLPPVAAAEIVRRARGRLRRKRAVPVERLREEAIGRYLIRRWEEALAELEWARSEPPMVQNTDGDPLLVTTDHFAIAPGARSDVEARLAAMKGVEPLDDDEEPRTYHFLRSGNAMLESWDNTVIGRAELAGAELVVETNSRERADALRERIESACGEGIRHRARTHSDPLSSKAARRESGEEPEPPSPEAEQLMLEFKERHYADWPDHSLPALNGKTPREAVATAQGRTAVDVLLKDMENHEQRLFAAAPFDFSRIRRELGLD